MTLCQMRTFRLDCCAGLKWNVCKSAKAKQWKQHHGAGSIIHLLPANLTKIVIFQQVELANLMCPSQSFDTIIIADPNKWASMEAVKRQPFSGTVFQWLSFNSHFKKKKSINDSQAANFQGNRDMILSPMHSMLGGLILQLQMTRFDEGQNCHCMLVCSQVQDTWINDLEKGEFENDCKGGGHKKGGAHACWHLCFKMAKQFLCCWTHE